MNTASFLVMLTIGLALAAGGATLYIQNAHTLAQDPVIRQDSAQPRLIQAVTYNISNQSAKHIRFQVASDQPVRVNQTQIRIKTGGQTAALKYRDGTLTRNQSTGFYTQ